MKKNIVLYLAFLFLFSKKNLSVGKLLPCKESVESDVCFIGDKTDHYVASAFPKPLPTEIEIDLKIRDIIEVDELRQTVTLSMKAHLEWKDQRLNVKRSKEDIEK